MSEGDQEGERKDWIEKRLKELDAIFAVSVGGFSIMDNHLHLLYGKMFGSVFRRPMLVEYTGRFLRQGKASITAELTDIFERLGTTADAWQARMQRLRGGRLFGRFIASSREALRNVAQRLGVQRLANLSAMQTGSLRPIG